VYALIAFYLSRRDEIDACLDTVRFQKAGLLNGLNLAPRWPKFAGGFWPEGRSPKCTVS
jgi:hypothetical protein